MRNAWLQIFQIRNAKVNVNNFRTGGIRSLHSAGLFFIYHPTPSLVYLQGAANNEWDRIEKKSCLLHRGQVFCCGLIQKQLLFANWSALRRVVLGIGWV